MRRSFISYNFNPFNTMGVGPTPPVRFQPLHTLEAYNSISKGFRALNSSVLERELNFKKN